jgi:hypothetical protein
MAADDGAELIGRPGDEATLELRGVEGRKDVAHMAVRGRVVGKLAEPAQRVELRPPDKTLRDRRML